MKKETETETLIKSSWSLKECFNQLRDESGVVKLTIEQQDEICGMVGKKEAIDGFHVNAYWTDNKDTKDFDLKTNRKFKKF